MTRLRCVALAAALFFSLQQLPQTYTSQGETLEEITRRFCPGLVDPTRWMVIPRLAGNERLQAYVGPAGTTRRGEVVRLPPDLCGSPFDQALRQFVAATVRTAVDSAVAAIAVARPAPADTAPVAAAPTDTLPADTVSVTEAPGRSPWFWASVVAAFAALVGLVAGGYRWLRRRRSRPVVGRVVPVLVLLILPALAEAQETNVCVDDDSGGSWLVGLSRGGLSYSIAPAGEPMFFGDFAPGSSTNLPNREAQRFDQLVVSLRSDQRLCIRGTADALEWDSRRNLPVTYHRLDVSLANARAFWALERAGGRAGLLRSDNRHRRRGFEVHVVTPGALPVPLDEGRVRELIAEALRDVRGEVRRDTVRVVEVQPQPYQLFPAPVERIIVERGGGPSWLVPAIGGAIVGGAIVYAVTREKPAAFANPGGPVGSRDPPNRVTIPLGSFVFP
ncbi:MAG: hypothetical protein HY378_01380 [Candidatus Brennerbacteria bacterium]|nr:hypothetical protein [Candidatus Brennerbacteria bacterium]